MRILHLHVKKKYFDQIKSGEKTQEYRLANSYWTKRLVYDVEPDLVMVYCGYPKKTDSSKVLIFPYAGFITIANFRHPEFGNEPVNVFAIRLQEGK